MTRKQIDERVLNCATNYIEQQSTVRAVGKQLGISKSMVHIYLTTRLEKLDKELYKDVRKLLDKNKHERHLRGGQATKNKYRLLKTPN